MTKKRPASKPGGVGITVDREGRPVDPTANVLDLVAKETKRQDDLRAMGEKLQQAETNRINAELGCIKEIANLRARHDHELRKSEAKRLDSIRQVDISAVNTAAVEVRNAITALAKTNSDTAETLRTTVTTTADRLAASTRDSFDGLSNRIAALELAAAQGIGKQAVADPAMERLTAVVEALAKAQQTSAGERRGVSGVWVFALGAFGLVQTLLAIGVGAYAVLK